MSIPATTTFSNPDPSLKFTTITALVDLLGDLVSTILPQDLTPYVTGNATPSVDDQDKIWHRYDALGRPIGTYKYYDGNWRREYNASPGEIRYFTGDPTVYFDGTGKGLIGGLWDGWALANGANGTANLSDLFIIGARMDNVPFTGYSGGLWRTNVTGAPLTTGGAATVTLNADTTYRPAIEAFSADKWTADGNTRDVSGGLFGSVDGGGASDFDIVPADAGNETPDPISIVPPFYAVAIVGFIGYD